MTGRGNGKGCGNSKVLWSSVRRRYEMELGTVAEICDLFEVSVGALYYRRRLEGWKKRRSAHSGRTELSVKLENEKPLHDLERVGAAEVLIGKGMTRRSAQTKMQTIAGPKEDLNGSVESGGKSLISKSEILKACARSDGRIFEVGGDGEAAGARSVGARSVGARSVGTRLYEVLEIKLAEIEDRIARGETLTVEENEREQRLIGNLIRNFDKLTEFNERRTKGAVKSGQVGGKARGDDDGTSDLTKLNAVQFREEIARRIEHFEKAGKS